MSIFKILKDHRVKFFLLWSVCLVGLMWLWTRGGWSSFYLDTDFGRDLSQLSNLWLGRIVWLGPRLDPGFPASPIYYYLIYPALWLSGGRPESLLAAAAVFSALVLTIWTYLGFQKWGSKIFPAALIIGSAPAWLHIAAHPGNGYTYAIWLVLGLSALYFEWPLFYGALALGLAGAYHPAAMMAWPILLFEWWWWRHQSAWWLSIISIIVGILGPWGPIILFEIITKGYLVREWLNRPAMSFHLQPGWSNLQLISLHWGWPLILILAFWLLAIKLADRRIKIWWLDIGLSVLFISLMSPMRMHYLIGLTLTILVISLWSILSHKYSLIWLTIWAIVSLSLAVKKPIIMPSIRTIPNLTQVIQTLVASQVLDRHQPIAVVAIITSGTQVPQADDYRFFLRLQGYQVLEVQQYGQAKQLVMFGEVSGFDYAKWSSWETDQFGAKNTDHLKYQQTINGVTVLVWQK